MKLDIKKFFSGIVSWGRTHSSDLKMGVGTAGVIGGTVFLCKGAIKANDIVKEYREEKQRLTELVDNGELDKKAVRKLMMKTVGRVAGAVAPGAALEATGMALMWGGYSETKVALVGLGTAYNELKDFTDKYRDGVREKYGEEVDEQLAYQFRTEEVVVKAEDGTERTETIRIYPNDYRKMPTPYARYFVYGEAEGAERSDSYNDKFLDLQEDLANHCLRARRKFMLNDLYDMLGIKRSKAGNRVGWVYDPENPEGDNKIKLRKQWVYREKFDDFGNPDGWEKVLMIDPNVDGAVEEKMIRMGLMDE